MRFFRSCLRCACSSRLKSFRAWIIVLLLPLLVLSALDLMPGEELSAPVRVGISDCSEELWQLLEQRSGTVVTFVRSDTETMEQKVATAQWDCGLIPAEDFEEKIADGDTDRLFTLLISEGSAAYPLVRETVAACVAELVNEEIAVQYLLDSGIMEESMLLAVQPRLESLLPESDRILVSMKTADGSPLSPVDLGERGAVDVLRWLICAVVLVWLGLCATELGRWSENPAVRRMGALRSKSTLLLCRILIDVLLAAFSGCVSLLCLGGGFTECAGVVCYALVLGMAAVVLAHFPVVWSAIPVVMPFLPVISLLVSGVIVDVGRFLPNAAKVTRFFPVCLFLRVCNGERILIPVMILTALVLGLISYGIDRISVKKPA